MIMDMLECEDWNSAALSKRKWFPYFIGPQLRKRWSHIPGELFPYIL
jgi:hypothetical protein